MNISKSSLVHMGTHGRQVPRLIIAHQAKKGAAKSPGKPATSDYDVFKSNKKWTGKTEIEMPEWHEASEIEVEGQVVKTTTGSLEKYVTDVWSGNHPFYKSRGKTQDIVATDSQVKKFNEQWSNSSTLTDIDALLAAIEEEDNLRKELGLGEMKVKIDEGIKIKSKKGKKKGKK